MEQIGLAVAQYSDTHRRTFSLHHPLLADVEALARQRLAGDLIGRCPDDRSETVLVREESSQPDGLAHRTSYLLNSLLTHKTRRYGTWPRSRFQQTVGRSKFICMVERNADQFTEALGTDPRQDDFDIWLGTDIIGPWIASQRHAGTANSLSLDGHVVAASWSDAVVDLDPDKVVLVADGTYAQ